MKTTKKNTAPMDFPSFRPVKPLEQITAEFIAKQKQGQKKDGENSVIPDFSLAIRMICSNYQGQSFNFNDVLALTRHLDTSAEDLIPLWHEWVDVMKAERRIKVINIIGIPQYTLV
jgi:hypothetical protein